MQAQRPVARKPAQIAVIAPRDPVSVPSAVFWSETSGGVRPSIGEKELSDWHYNRRAVSIGTLFGLLEDRSQDDGVRNEVMNILRTRAESRDEFIARSLVRANDRHETVRMRDFFIQHLGLVYANMEPDAQRQTIGEWLAACVGDGARDLALRRESLFALGRDPRGSYNDMVHDTVQKILRGDVQWQGFGDVAIRLAVELDWQEFQMDITTCSSSGDAATRLQARLALANFAERSSRNVP